MMNQTDYELENNHAGWILFREKFSNYISGIAAFFAVVIMGLLAISTFAIVAVDTSNNFTLPSLLSALLSIALACYSALTTRTEIGSAKYKFILYVKRLIDVVIATLLIFTLLPLLILIIIAIRIESPGPVIYRSKRIGQFGKYFYWYKFRTMYLESSDKKGVTRVGKILRRFSFNELPGIYNVLIGDISLVGPWPRPPDLLDEFVDPNKKILTVKPGITGPSQISGTWESPEDVIDKDLGYVDNLSILTDLKLLIGTAYSVFKSR